LLNNQCKKHLKDSKMPRSNLFCVFSSIANVYSTYYEISLSVFFNGYARINHHEL